MTMQFTMRSNADHAHSRALASERRLCRRLVAVTLPVFLVAAAIRRVLPGQVPQRAGRRLSLWAEARASAYATIPFMFMG